MKNKEFLKEIEWKLYNLTQEILKKTGEVWEICAFQEGTKEHKKVRKIIEKSYLKKSINFQVK